MIENHQDALVITTRVGNHTVKKILIDNGSCVDILYHHTFSRMNIRDKRLENIRTLLYGFTGNEVKVLGTIDLPVLFRTPPRQISKDVKFHVISAASSYNAILGRTTIMSLKAITSIPHLKMKFPIELGVGEVVGDHVIARQCYLTTVKPKKDNNGNRSINQVAKVDPQNISTNPNCTPISDTVNIEVIEGHPDKTTKIGKDLPNLL